MDSQEYEENIDITANRTLDAKYATLKGTAQLRGGARFYINKHIAQTTGTTLLTKWDAAHSYYQAVLSTPNGQTNITNIKNQTGNSILFANIQYLITSFRGIQDFSAGSGEIAGHIHFEVKDLYLHGNNAIALDVSSANSDFVGKIDHIRRLG